VALECDPDHTPAIIAAEQALDIGLFDGSANGDIDLTKLTPGSGPTATPTPK
jgi:hypothetical protein